MFNVVRVQNVEEFQRYDEKSRITFQASSDEGTIGGEFELKTVGPCVARLFLEPEGKEKIGKEYLLGTYEGSVTVQFSIKADRCAVRLEPSGEVWYRKSNAFAVAENPNPDENFTRMEHMGLEMDELSTVLHRQAILNNIQQSRQQLVNDQYTRKLERQIAETNATVAKLLEAQQARAEAAAQERGEGNEAA